MACKIRLVLAFLCVACVAFATLTATVPIELATSGVMNLLLVVLNFSFKLSAQRFQPLDCSPLQRDSLRIPSEFAAERVIPRREPVELYAVLPAERFEHVPVSDVGRQPRWSSNTRRACSVTVIPAL